MLTLLSTKDVNQLQAYLVEIGTALENLTQVLEHAQTVDIAVEQPVRTLSVQTKSQRKTRASRRRGRGRKALNANQVAEIKGALQGGATAMSQARKYGVHVTTINCIKWGRTWKTVAPAVAQEVSV
jgi:hypothetical protein